MKHLESKCIKCIRQKIPSKQNTPDRFSLHSAMKFCCVFGRERNLAQPNASGRGEVRLRTVPGFCRSEVQVHKVTNNKSSHLTDLLLT